MKKLLKNNFWILGAVFGAAGGFLYWKYIACMSSTCTIPSKAVNNMVYFGMMGGFIYSDKSERGYILP